MADIGFGLQVVIGWGIEDFFGLTIWEVKELGNLVSLGYVGKWQERIEQHRAASMGQYAEQKYLKQSALSLSRSLDSAWIAFGVVAENNCRKDVTK